MGDLDLLCLAKNHRNLLGWTVFVLQSVVLIARICTLRGVKGQPECMVLIFWPMTRLFQDFLIELQSVCWRILASQCFIGGPAITLEVGCRMLWIERERMAKRSGSPNPPTTPPFTNSSTKPRIGMTSQPENTTYPYLSP